MRPMTPDNRAESAKIEQAAVTDVAAPPQMALARDDLLQRTNRYLAGDIEAMRRYRPGFKFWQHVFKVPDGRMVFGSALDGRLLATFRTSGDWAQSAEWAEASLSEALREQSIDGRLAERSDRTAKLLDQLVGTVLPIVSAADVDAVDGGEDLARLDEILVDRADGEDSDDERAGDPDADVELACPALFARGSGDAAFASWSGLGLLAALLP